MGAASSSGNRNNAAMPPPNEIVEIAPGLWAHGSGALWLPEIETAVIADLHLGYSWAQRRRGELGPLADGRTCEKLFAARDALNPRQFVFLGDIVHAPRACTPEREWIEQTLLELRNSAHLVAVRGNHDRRFATEFGHLEFETADTWSHGQFTMVHGDRWNFAWPEQHTLVMGHIHPSLAVRDASGAGRKLPVFLVGRQCIVLPAFSPFARGYDVASGLPAEICNYLQKSEIQTYAATGKRVVRLGSLAAAMTAIAENDTSPAAQFRRRQRRSRL